MSVTASVSGRSFAGEKEAGGGVVSALLKRIAYSFLYSLRTTVAWYLSVARHVARRLCAHPPLLFFSGPHEALGLSARRGISSGLISAAPANPHAITAGSRSVRLRSKTSLGPNSSGRRPQERNMCSLILSACKFFLRSMSRSVPVQKSPSGQCRSGSRAPWVAGDGVAGGRRLG